MQQSGGTRSVDNQNVLSILHLVLIFVLTVSSILSNQTKLILLDSLVQEGTAGGYCRVFVSIRN